MLRCNLLLCFVLCLGCSGAPAEKFAEHAQKKFQEGDYAAALKYFERAIEKDPDEPTFYGGRGNCQAALGDIDAALKDFSTAIDKAIKFSANPHDPKLARFYSDRGLVLDHAKRIPEAIADFVRVTELDPNYAQAHNYCAWTWATHPDPSLRNPAKAVEYALAETKLPGGDHSAVLDTLAAAYAASGDFELACTTQRQAIGKLTDYSDRPGYEARLKLYEQDQPYIDYD